MNFYVVDAASLFASMQKRIQECDSIPSFHCNGMPVSIWELISSCLGTPFKLLPLIGWATIPWDAIQTTTVDWMGYDPLARGSPKLVPSPGPHAALGIIHYTPNQQGYLLYIKSSLTGDERHFVRDYSRRYARFPHERTGKQFFNEEQFEVYRVLGLHMAYGVFIGRDLIQVAGGKQLKFTDASDAAIKAVREALLPPSEHAPTTQSEDMFAAGRRWPSVDRPNPE